jgi:glycogen debranching enzyme
LELRPLIAFRDYHATTHENAALRADVDVVPGGLKIAPYEGCPPMYLWHPGGRFERTGSWYRNFEYDRERERGLDFREDLFQPFVLTIDLRGGQAISVIASLSPRARTGFSEQRESPRPSQLAQAADRFLVKRGAGKTVIAGYHWFTDWGRDTMIALPGLTLATGKPEVAREILLAFAAAVDRGMLPNRFPDVGEQPEYNTVDATLWFFEAVRAYAESTKDFDLIRQRFYGVLADIVAWHERGTRYGIRVRHDGLIAAGEPGVQLTWMDAKVGDWVVTPRMGKPVEIQALWYNALRIMEQFAARLGDPARGAHYRDLAVRVKTAFSALFWNHDQACLYDVVDGDSKDASIRPNQIFAVSLPHKLLEGERARMVVETVRRHLLTPFGLRTLAPSDPAYRGRYEGDVRNRDGAYHQGTVWPWLIGPFLQAYIEVNGRSREACQQAADWLAPLIAFLHEEGCGQLPEVFDGDPPHRPGGAIAQAWSVAEVLRIRAQLVAAGCVDRLPYKE